MGDEALLVVLPLLEVVPDQLEGVGAGWAVQLAYDHAGVGQLLRPRVLKQQLLCDDLVPLTTLVFLPTGE